MAKMKPYIMAIVLIAAMVAGTGIAAAFPGGTWVSGISIVNLSSSDTATIALEFFDQSGASVFTLAGETIAAGGQKTYYVPGVSGFPASFVGSAVISSDQPVAANVNTQVPTSGTGTMDNPNRVGTSAGVATPSATAYAPQIMRDYYGWNSYCAVQNTSTSSSTITEYVYDAGGALVDTNTQNVAAYASYIFDHEDNTGLGSSFVGSSKYDGGGADIAVVCNFYNDNLTHEDAQFHSYNGFASGAETLYLPRLVKDYYNYQSGLKIQNVGGSDITVDVTYYFGGVEYTQTSPTIGAGQAWGPYMGSEGQLPGSMAGVSGSGAGKVEAPSGATIVAIVNEDNRVGPAGRGSTYGGFSASDASHDIFFAQILAKYYGYSGGLQFQNIESTTATCSVTYNPGNIVASGISVGAGTSYSAFAPSFVPQDFNGSASVSCDKNVVGIGNLSFRSDIDSRYGENYGDSFATYNGINQ